MTTELRPVSESDLPGVLALNNAAVPALNELDAANVAWFSEHAAVFDVAVDGDGLVGFLIGLTEGSSYGSPNYGWFRDRYERFVYVDRVAVAPRSRSQGVARRLYDRLAAVGAASGAPVMLAEVNLRPRNDVSLAFHERYGFRPVGEQDTEGGTKRVVLLERDLAPADAGAAVPATSGGADAAGAGTVRQLRRRDGRPRRGPPPLRDARRLGPRAGGHPGRGDRALVLPVPHHVPPRGHLRQRRAPRASGDTPRREQACEVGVGARHHAVTG